MEHFRDLHSEAVALLRDLSTPHGILASLIAADNYKRIWARDSIVCGIAGILEDDPQITQGLKQSLLTLSRAQHPSGMIPSNVDPDDTDKVSYGSLAGRVDTNTWFIIGVCLYVKYSNDVSFLSEMEAVVEKSRAYLRSIEFNGRGWIYTPLSGNWADEYPVHGYTLYDNCLRIWAENLWHDITEEESDISQELIDKTITNFWPSAQSNPELIYQSEAFNKAVSDSTPYFCAYLLPGLYEKRFDAAGNALAMLLFGLNQMQQTKTSAWLEQLNSSIGKDLIPAFWPVIDEQDKDWHLLAHNFSYDFKNHPGQFHNGGIWPVWMGLYCMALSRNGLQSQAKRIIEDFSALVDQNPSWQFNEYIDANTHELMGKNKMGYTASGIVFMNTVLNPSNFDLGF